jgi:hypothetical protein
MSENQVMATGAGPATSTTREGHRVALTVFHWALAAFLLLCAVQIFLAGLGAFSLMHGHPGAFGAHQSMGWVIAGAALVILLISLAARPGRAGIAGAAALFVLTSFVQSLLAGLGDDHALYGGLHAFDGLAIIGIAAWLWARSRVPARPREPQAPR